MVRLLTSQDKSVVPEKIVVLVEYLTWNRK
jgi:hypothetical protein